jgi:hypothetical protein
MHWAFAEDLLHLLEGNKENATFHSRTLLPFRNGLKTNDIWHTTNLLVGNSSDSACALLNLIGKANDSEPTTKLLVGKTSDRGPILLSPAKVSPSRS